MVNFRRVHTVFAGGVCGVVKFGYKELDFNCWNNTINELYGNVEQNK